MQPSLRPILPSCGAAWRRSRRRSRRAPTPRKRPAAFRKRTSSALRNIGYFDIVKPAMFGGYEHDFDVLVELNIELAKSCASTAWVGGLLAAHQWLIAGFPGRRAARRLGQTIPMRSPAAPTRRPPRRSRSTAAIASPGAGRLPAAATTRNGRCARRCCRRRPRAASLRRPSCWFLLRTTSSTTPGMSLGSAAPAARRWYCRTCSCPRTAC